MKLTAKDKEFLERLRAVLDQKQMSIEMKDDGRKRLILRQNYGDKIEQDFGMSRQGVRWRFQRLFNDVYVEAYERVWWVESIFGAELRHHAVAMAKERIELRKRVQKTTPISLRRREETGQGPCPQDRES